MSEPSNDWHAAVLSGGAAYAAYEVGVLNALTRGACAVSGYQPVEFQVLTGTSAGSFNAAIMASRPGESCATTAAYLEQVWLQGIAARPGMCGNGAIRYRGDPTTFFDASCYSPNPLRPFTEFASDAAYFATDLANRAVTFASSQGSLSQRLLAVANLSSFISTDPYAALVRAVVDLDGIRRSDRILLIATTDWGTGLLRLFGNADLSDEIGHLVILASSAFPGVPPVQIDGQPYADGGYVLDTPLKPAVFAGADTLHVVYMDPDTRNIPLSRMQNTIDTVDRSINIFKAAIFDRDFECANDINTGLTILENPNSATALTFDQRKSLLRFVGRVQNQAGDPMMFRKITVHRYHPTDDLGGVAGLLNFDQDQITRLIQRGFNDAVEHDCAASACLLPN